MNGSNRERKKHTEDLDSIINKLDVIENVILNPVIIKFIFLYWNTHKIWPYSKPNRKSFFKKRNKKGEMMPTHF